MKNTRFNCVMTEDTRKKLHSMAEQVGRSDSNMVTYLINEAYTCMTMKNKKTGKRNRNYDSTNH